jgi:transposase
VKAILPVEAKHKPVQIWFQDEARVGQKANLSYLWAIKGTRPQVKRDTRFANCYIFGAICPERETGEALIMPRCNTEAMNQHLAIISQNVGENAHAILVLDGAGWHKAKALIVPSTITLTHLPPYSPELMPVENVWQYLKGNCLNSRIYKDYDEIVYACEKAWNCLINDPNRIKSITKRDWFIGQ